MNADRSVVPKLIFANQLRGIAALLVMTIHLAGIFWLSRDYVATVTFSPIQSGSSPIDGSLLATRWHNLGPLGVALFYLISGFVIPFSFRHHTRFSFLAARLVRIYPVYIACIFLDVLVLYASSVYWQRPFTLSAKEIFYNLALINNFASIRSIDLVNITLATEMRFYILCVLLFSFIKTGKTSPLYASAILLCVLCLIFNFTPHIGAIYAYVFSESDIFYIIYMLIGVLFHYEFNGHIRKTHLLGGTVLLLGLFAVCLKLSKPIIFYVLTNYLYALAIFAMAYFSRRHFRKFPPLDWLAAISYPLYLLHTMLGFTLLKVLLITLGMSPAPALIVTFVVVAAIAWIIHHVLELRSIAFGRRLGGHENPV